MIVAAPDVIEYSPAVQERAFQEMYDLGWVTEDHKNEVPPCLQNEVFEGCSALKMLVNDYKFMRDQIRAAGK